MKRIPKLLKIFFMGTTLFTIVAIAFLETGSRYYKCPATDQLSQNVLVCDLNHYSINQNKIQTIQRLIELKQQGIEPSREDLDQAINLVKYQDMYGLNGVSCGDGMIFVRDNLGGDGKYFVARHELEHVFRQNGIDNGCKEEEYCATISAVKVYPVGFVETIVSSLYTALRESPTIWCFLFGSWRIFRTYIFPW